MRISIIAAYGKNREIGYQNKLLWHISNDLKRFKKITSEHTVIMGRLTFESIGSKALPRRRNIVLSKVLHTDTEAVDIAHSVQEALEMIKDDNEVFIIGGSEIYEQFLPSATRMYLTHIQKSFRADTFFPEFSKEEWEESDRVDIRDDLQANVNYSFVTLERIK